MKKLLLLLFLVSQISYAQKTFTFGTNVNPQGVKFEVDSKGFVVGGKHVLPVMGEIHYARVPAKDWRREIRKMKAGGITIAATYVFWIHHEPEEGHWNWAGNMNLREFLEVCKSEDMPVVLRIGPFCHGEVYQGGFPDWVVERHVSNPKEYKVRSMAKGFMKEVEHLYYNIFGQVNGMLWKDGGPIVGVQIENECRGPWAYYMALKDIAVKAGFDVPFMTRTGWPKLNGKEEFGKLLPLYGDYADGFWDRKLTDMPGDYSKAFIFKDDRMSRVIATETFSADELKENKTDLSYPYLTCELGGGMMPSYHRRINMSGNEALPLAICKLGSGSNLPGYYMYHGGTNPYNPAHTMAETQKTAVTNYNDMPYMTYDFQCPLGEMGQPNAVAFHQTRLLHQFLADWGEELSLMDVDTLSEHYARRGCFEFYNDYVRMRNEDGRCYVRPVGMPFCGHTITADAQPFCKVGNTLYLIPIKDMKPSVSVDGKKRMLNAKKPLAMGDIQIVLLPVEKANCAYKIDGALHYAQHEDGIFYKDGDRIVEEYWQTTDDRVEVRKIQDAAAPREIPKGKQKVASMPEDSDFDKAAIYIIGVDTALAAKADSAFLEINYEGDCARVYADGKLVEDNFWNGKPMLVRVSDLVAKKTELRILPLRKDAPIYLQKEQKAILDAVDNHLLSLSGVRVIRVKNEEFKVKSEK
ncbi:MAG: beta-galactosidase [Prevotellaceae bacterium]|nr:beta-galactosidase [Prevotellaceae bacterium]